MYEHSPVIFGIVIFIVLFYTLFFSKKTSGKKLMLFYRPDCGHCQRLKPEWDRFEHMADSDLEIQKINITDNTDIASHYNVQGVPTIMLLKGEFRMDYNGNRTAEDILHFTKSS